MHSRLLLIVLFFCTVSFFSCKKHTNHRAIENGVLTLTSRACNFGHVDSLEKKLKIKLDEPSTRELQEINTIMDYVGLPQNFTIYRGDVDNAMATFADNQRLIIYNKDLFSTIDAIDNSYWSSLFIIAHEIGHHLSYNILDENNQKKSEIEADRFAANILYKMGADSLEVISAVSSHLISNIEDTPTHPSKSKRITAVKDSWKTASMLSYRSAVPPEPDNDDFILDNEDITYSYEFQPYELMGYINEDEFKKSYYYNMYNSNKTELQHGVILKQINGEKDEELDFLQITKVYIQLYDGTIDNNKKAERIWVELLPETTDLTKATRDLLYRALRVGRRIEFRTFNNSPFLSWFGYIKVDRKK